MKLKEYIDFAKRTTTVLAIAGSLFISGCRGSESSPKPAPMPTASATIENEKTEAERVLESFPSNIQGAREIRKYQVEDAKYCVVYIKNSHGRPPNEMKEMGFSEKEIMEIQEERHAVQVDVYTILLGLTKRYSRDVYDEGMTPEQEKAIKSVSLEELNKMIKSGKVKIYSATEKLYVQGKINMISGNTEESANYNNEVMLDYAMSRDNTIWDPSEDIVLQHLLEYQETKTSIRILVYGGLHDFGNNVNRWNRENPQYKISLVEIFPTSYKGPE